MEIKEGQLYINGQSCRLQELGAASVRNHDRQITGHTYMETNNNVSYPVFISDSEKDRAPDFPATKVPEYCCFTMNDNRSITLDSRHFGPIQITAITGRVDYLYCPVDDWGRFGRIAPSR